MQKPFDGYVDGRPSLSYTTTTHLYYMYILIYRRTKTTVDAIFELPIVVADVDGGKCRREGAAI